MKAESVYNVEYSTEQKQAQLNLAIALVKEWKLNKVLLAIKMGMSPSTFKMKLTGINPQYFFSESELDRLTEVLGELAGDIGQVSSTVNNNNTLAGVGYNGSASYS